jgi:CBS domain-containing protein
MLQLRDIMTSDVISVAPETPLAEVAQLFATEGISGVPVVSAGRVVGVLSATDLVDFSASERGDTGEDGRGPVWGPYEDDVDAAPGHAGFFTDGWPGARSALHSTDREDEADGPANAWGEFTASDLMTRSLFALSPATPLDVAAQFMLERGIHRVLVTEGESLRGIVTSMDFVRVIAKHVQPAPAV